MPIPTFGVVKPAVTNTREYVRTAAGMSSDVPEVTPRTTMDEHLLYASEKLFGGAHVMRTFATESGGSKGQFHTPAEVARVLAKAVEVGNCTNRRAAVCDPACGSGSLPIRVLAEAPFELAGYGQEKDDATAGLAKTSAVLHGKPTVNVCTGNTFADPHNYDTGTHDTLRRFDYIVANPPSSSAILDSRPTFMGLPVHVRHNPKRGDRGEGYWHLTCCDYGKEGNGPESRNPDTNRCERLEWSRAFVENYQACGTAGRLAPSAEEKGR